MPNYKLLNRSHIEISPMSVLLLQSLCNLNCPQNKWMLNIDKQTSKTIYALTAHHKKKGGILLGVPSSCWRVPYLKCSTAQLGSEGKNGAGAGLSGTAELGVGFSNELQPLSKKTNKKPNNHSREAKKTTTFNWIQIKLTGYMQKQKTSMSEQLVMIKQITKC